MKSDEILLLVKAGYTRQEIEAMDQAPAPAQGSPAADPVPPAADQAQPAMGAAPVPPAADQAQPAMGAAPVAPAANQAQPSVKPSPAPAPAVDASVILSAIDGLGAKITAAMQAASLSAAMMRTPSENESVEQVVASIINPKE